MFCLTGLNISATQAGIIGIGLHYACYTAEVYRSGFNGIPTGQWEAIKALNIPGRAAYLDIIFPQVIRPVVPALGNYFIAMFKDTPVLSAITVVEIMQEAKNIGSENFHYLEPITLVGCFFLTISIVLAILFNKIEKKVVTIKRSVTMNVAQKPDSQPLVRFNHVDKYFGDLRVLNDLNLAVAPAEKLAIIGPSGSGNPPYCAP
jgi:ABC-type arginine transport system permease subunit